MIVEMNKRLNRISCDNFDGGVKFVISSRGSTITSPTLTLTYSIYHYSTYNKTTRYNFYPFNYFSNLSIISFNISNFYYNYFSTFYFSIIIPTTSTGGAFNFIYTPKGIIITNYYCISIFIITIIIFCYFIWIFISVFCSINFCDFFFF